MSWHLRWLSLGRLIFLDATRITVQLHLAIHPQLMNFSGQRIAAPA